MKKRLSKALAAAGISSRRKCEELIFSGKVVVNGKIELVPQTLVDLSIDNVQVDGRKIKAEEKKVYLLLNKPRGYICSHQKEGTKKIIYNILPQTHRLFTAGRLDRDTSGLMIVSNDGQFINKVIHPSSNITKEYLVKTQEEITDEHLKMISNGIYIEDQHIRPAKVTKIRNGTLKIAVKEGKKHEVRLLVKQAELTLLELKRIRIGALTLGDLPIGTYREMKESEKALLFS